MGGRGGGKIMPVVGGRGWRRRNYGWSWMLVGGGGNIVAGCGCSWVVVDGHGWSHDLIIPVKKSIRLNLLKTCFLYITPAK